MAKMREGFYELEAGTIIHLNQITSFTPAEHTTDGKARLIVSGQNYSGILTVFDGEEINKWLYLC